MGTNLLTYKLFISEVINRLNKAYKLDFEEHSSAGRALEWHSRGQRFDPAYLHQKQPTTRLKLVVGFLTNIHLDRIPVTKRNASLRSWKEAFRLNS